MSERNKLHLNECWKQKKCEIVLRKEMEGKCSTQIGLRKVGICKKKGSFPGSLLLCWRFLIILARFTALIVRQLLSQFYRYTVFPVAPRHPRAFNYHFVFRGEFLGSLALSATDFCIIFAFRLHTYTSRDNFLS